LIPIQAGTSEERISEKTSSAGLGGSFIPLAKTKAEPETSHDPRLSLEEK